MDTQIFKKTRFAPTPSGYLHLGNILSFSITAALAKRNNAKIFLRIDDNDHLRTGKVFVQDIFDTLDFLDIPWHEGPKDMVEYEKEYSQQHRMDRYNAVVQQLKDSGALFACTCSRAQLMALCPDSAYTGTCRRMGLPFDAGNTSWRLRTTDKKSIVLKNLRGNRTEAFLPPIMNDFIIRRKDGTPGYQLTSLLDDMLYGIDMIVRGEDLRPSSLAQLYLAEVLGFDTFTGTMFYHHPLIIGPDGEKLSKSGGATSIQHLRKEHKTPADVYTMIAASLGFKTPAKNWEELAGLMEI